MREVRDEEIADLERIVANYVERGKFYKAALPGSQLQLRSDGPMSLRRRNLLLFVAVGLVLLGSIWSPIGGDGRWTEEFLTAGHGIAFAVTAMLAIFALSVGSRTQRWPLIVQYGIVFVLTALLGLGTEFIQIWLPRDANLDDVRTDLLGAWIGIATFAVFDARLRTLGRIGIPLSGLIPFFVLAVPLVTCIQAYVRRQAAFPILADYRLSFDDYFLQAQGTSRAHDFLPQAWAGFTGEQAMRVSFGTSAWPGLHFAEPSPDWRGFETLAIDVTNPNQQTLPLSIRIHDRAHNNQYSDRFNAQVELDPLERSVVRLPISDISSAPRNRDLDIEEVSGLILFVSGNSEPERIGEGLIRLTNLARVRKGER